MIIATRDGDVHVRDVSLGSLMALNGIPLRGDAGAYASASDVAGLPAVQQAIRIASESIAKLTLAVWRGKEPNRGLVEATWQARFFASPPNERGDTWFYTWEATEASLTARNNAYWLKSHDLLTGRVNRVQLWHPDGVRVRWNRDAHRAEYQLLLENGSWSDWLTSAEVLHFRKGAPSPGAVVAPSPLELHRRAWSIALEKQRAEQSVYSRGNKKTVAVVYPETITPDQVGRWREIYLDGQADSDVKVFGGNPRVETIGLSFEDLQFVETQQFSIEDIGRMLGVPPSLLWAASPKGDKPLTPEHEEDRWFRYGSEPRRTRIEQSILVDPDFFGVGARDYPMFIGAPIRADRDTEVRSYVSLVQAGIIVPDSAAEALGFPHLPNGLGQIPQITPVGGAPNEAPTQAPAGE